MKILKIKSSWKEFYFISKDIKVSSNFKIGGNISPSLFYIVDISKQDTDKCRYYRATEEALELTKNDHCFAPIILIKINGELTYVSYLEAYELFLKNGEQAEYNTNGEESGDLIKEDFGMGGLTHQDYIIKNINLRNGKLINIRTGEMITV